MTKVNNNTMREQYDGQYKTFCKKNSDYGNSFEESLDKHGIVASIVRMGDKMNRLESLTDDSRTQQVGSESLLDTLEDLSNYAAMTACWLKGVRAEDVEEEVIGSVYVFGQDEPYMTFKKPKTEKLDDDNLVDVIRYNVQDAKDTTERRLDPRQYILKMLGDIFRVVRKKMEKDEMLVLMDISDEAGLIAKCMVQSNAHEECVAVINNYMCNRKDIPHELKDWIYGVIMHHFYYLNKEKTEIDKIPGGDKSSENEVKQCEDNIIDINRYVQENKDLIELSEKMENVMNVLFQNILVHRHPSYYSNRQRLEAHNYRQTCYQNIAEILQECGIDCDQFSEYLEGRQDLLLWEKKMIFDEVKEALRPRSEYMEKKFHIPTEEVETENLTFKPQEEEKEEKEPLNEKMFKAFLWLFHPIIDMNYRGDDND